MPMPTEHHATSRVLDVLDLLASADEQGYTLTEIAARIGFSQKAASFQSCALYAAAAFFCVRRRHQPLYHRAWRYAVGCAFCTARPCWIICTPRCAPLHLPAAKPASWACGIRGMCCTSPSEDSSQPIQLISHVGKRLPLYATALGKALLLDASPAELEALYPHIEAWWLSPATLL